MKQLLMTPAVLSAIPEISVQRAKLSALKTSYCKTFSNIQAILASPIVFLLFSLVVSKVCNIHQHKLTALTLTLSVVYMLPAPLMSARPITKLWKRMHLSYVSVICGCRADMS